MIFQYLGTVVLNWAVIALDINWHLTYHGDSAESEAMCLWT